MEITFNPKEQIITVKPEENLAISFAQIKNLIQSQAAMSDRSIRDMLEAMRYGQAEL